MEFQIEATDSVTQARAGTLTLSHGIVPTPIFMPVGTVGSVKAVQPRELEQDLDAPIILGNTYHLYLRPGIEVLRQAGGLHAFMGWKRNLLTDSGGYQVFSLAERRTIQEEGVEFRSHLDGSRHFFSPESVIDIQRIIGSDIMMVLDECPPADASRTYARQSHELTLRWAARCKQRFEETTPLYGFEQTLFPIVQGVTFPEIRRASAQQLVAMDFEGYAIGGLSVGEPAHQMYAMVEVVNEILPENKPRYLMGVGTPENILENIARGVDMFDCVMPTREGRNGRIYTTQGILNIKNRKWRTDFSPLDPGLETYTAQHFTKAYVHHLFKAGEILGLQIASLQNLSLYLWMVREARKQIINRQFASWKEAIIPQLMQRL